MIIVIYLRNSFQM